MPKLLTEQVIITEAAAAQAKETGKLPIQFISPGWGSSGYYSSAVIAEAAETKFIPAGTHMYADHPTDAEDLERPIRSIKDLMAVVAEDARIATEADVTGWGADLGALVGEADVVPAWQPLVETVRDHIGTSIRGSATDLVEGEAEGRRGRIVEGLIAPCTSVDFVTRAGRGGKVLRLLESAATNQRAIEHGVEEATVNDSREALDHALSDAYGGKDRGAYTRDFDDTRDTPVVWFTAYDNGESSLFQQTFTLTNGVIALTGERIEVRAVTTYVPVTRPDSTNPTTEETTEVTMGKIQVEESEHTRLVEQAGRVDTLTNERDTAIVERDTARGELATERHTNQAMGIVREHEHAFTPLEAKGLVAELPLKESGEFDADAFKTQLDEHAAAAKVAGGAGRISGMGTVTDAPANTTESSAPSKTAWGRPLNEQKGA